MAKRKVKAPLKRSVKKGKVSKNPFLLLTIGAILILIGGFYHIHQLRSLSFDRSYGVRHSKSVKSAPKQILIRSIQVSLPIAQTSIKNGTWEIFNDGASHLSTSANPDEHQPIIVYAHNRTSQFGNIGMLKKGDSIVLSSGKSHYLYSVNRQIVVNPSDIAALTKAKGETLILYTCTGWADSKRLLVYADRVD